ncbi:MAG: NAD-dependent deacetylase [candidate division TM6 bacterium GW2011_GWF2_32_72]|nr:MAG: NAD-dependent deacetylase [candidate division TM6 bacterium GW2011_GWF2_32_72]
MNNKFLFFFLTSCHISIFPNILLQAPKEATAKHMLKRSNEISFTFALSKNESIKFSYKNGTSEFSFQKANSHCSCETLKNLYTEIFEKAERLTNNFITTIRKTHRASGYIIYKNLIIPEKQRNPITISLEELAEIIKNKRVIFYTGAGISMPTVYGMDELEEKLRINKPKTILDNQEEVLNEWKIFINQLYESEPAQAHLEFAQMCLENNIQVLTELVDNLHEKSGIKPFHMSAERIRKKISENDLKEVDAIICIGLRFDDRGFLGWYKYNNPYGKIISIDIGMPTYLSEEDCLLKEDLNIVIPKLRKRLNNK